MIERMSSPQSSLLQEISDNHQIRFTHQFVGPQKLELGEGEAHVFLGVMDGKKVNVKTGNFNDNELEDTRVFGDLMQSEKGVRVPAVLWGDYDKSTGNIRSFATEHINGWPYPCELFWMSRPMMSRAMQAFDRIDQKLNRVIWPASKNYMGHGKNWLEQVLSNDWVEPATTSWIRPILEDKTLAENNLITPNFVGSIQRYLTKHEPELLDMRMALKDPNGDNLIWPAYDTEAQWVGVVDIGLVARPQHYMKMRFLAWSLVKIDSGGPDLEKRVDLETWVGKMRSEHHLGDEMSPTFVLSLTGILYDLTRWENGERDNKNRRLIAVAIKNIINKIIKKDEADDKKTS